MKTIYIIILVAVMLILVILIGDERYKDGLKDGKQSQINDNIKYGVMNEDGKWKDGFKLAR